MGLPQGLASEPLEVLLIALVVSFYFLSFDTVQTVPQCVANKNVYFLEVVVLRSVCFDASYYCSTSPESRYLPQSLWCSISQLTFLAISQSLYDQLSFFEQYAAAAYCSNNNDSPNTKVTCSPGNCPEVEAADTDTLTEFQK